MANDEMLDNEEQLNPDNGESNDGNFFSRYGKFFLVIVILLVQGSIAYALMNTYYEDVYSWIEQFNPRGEVYYSFENIIINPQGSAGERYLLLSVVIEVDSSSDTQFLEKHKAELIDKINTILTRRTATELADLETRDDIKKEIGLMINENMDRNAVRNLFFTKYVLQ